MSTCFVLGAGFSKAVAGLPVIKELPAKFQETQSLEESRGHTNRAKWGRLLLGYLEEFRREFFDEPYLRSGEHCEWCDFKENLEAIVTFIDLNLRTTTRARVVDGQGNSVSRTVDGAFWKWCTLDLQTLRRAIETYIYLALIGPHQRSDLLGGFVDCLRHGDAIVTFNYDLVIECELWRRQMWNPTDGYGVAFSGSEVDLAAKFSTSVPVYKLHGSLNWIPPDWAQDQVALKATYESGDPIFPGYLADESRPPYEYVGGHAPCWVMPSFVKDFSVPDLLTVWERAHHAVRASEEVVVIGYSLPEADSAAHLLFGAAWPSARRLTIVDPDVDELCQRFTRITGAKEPRPFKTVEEYVEYRRSPGQRED